MKLCKFLSCFSLSAALAVLVPLGLMYVMFGPTDELIRLWHVELCLLAASFITFMGASDA